MDARTQRRIKRDSIRKIDDLMKNPNYDMSESEFLRLTKYLTYYIPAKDYEFIHDPSGSVFSIETLGRREDGDIVKTLALLRSVILMKIGQEVEYEEYDSISIIRRVL